MSNPICNGLPAADSIDLDADAHLRETCIDSRQVYRGHFLELRRDEVALPDGKRAPREYVIHPGAVMIIPVLDDGRFVMERQYRYPVRQVMIEFPAGKLDPGESVQACAARELAEETGFTAAEWARAGVIHPVIGYANEVIEVWLARGLVRGQQHLDEGELIDVFAASLDELDAWVQQGRLTDAKTLSGLLWAHKWRSGAWALDWQRHGSVAAA